MCPAIYIETYGCAFNTADSEALAGILEQAGHRIVDDAAGADVVIINTCTVKDRTYLNFTKRLTELRRHDAHAGHPPLILAGCVPRAQEYGRRDPLLDGLAALGPETLDRAPEVVAAVLAGQAPRIVKPVDGEAPRRPGLPTRRREPHIEILPIAAGCLSACSFCQTRLARGRLRSYRPGDLLDRVRRAVDEGVREVWLTAQDTGAWGRDTGESLPRLVERICDVDGDFRVRVGMTSPHWVRDDLPAWLDAWAHPRLYRFLHTPVQSGSEAVVRAMRRDHSVADFELVCAAFLERFPGFGLMTDIIVGYPSESEEDFRATLDLLDRWRLPAVNRSKFSARPGTAAARLDPLHDSVVTERSLRLNEAVRRHARAWHSAHVGRRASVQTARNAAHNDTTLAHNDAYRPVVLPGLLPLGEQLEVEYIGAADFHLKARRIEAPVAPPPGAAARPE